MTPNAAISPFSPALPAMADGGGLAGVLGGSGAAAAPKVLVDHAQGVQRVRIARQHHGVAVLRRLLRSWGYEDERAAQCGYKLGSPEAGETWALARGKAQRCGRLSCGSAKVCAVCHDTRAIVRAAAVSVAVWRWLEADDEHSAVFVSVTPGHQTGDRLDLAHDRLMEAREAVMHPQRSGWRRFRREHGVRDVLWVAEHTVGVNGPHAQLHLVFLLDREWDAIDADRAHAQLWVAFRAELDRLGHTGGWGADRAIDVRPVVDGPGLAAYVAKIGLGAEVTGLSGKDAKAEGSIAYLAIPARLAELCGRRDPERVAQRNPEVARLLADLREYADLVYSPRERGRRWWKNFAGLRKLVPELADLEGQGLAGAALAAAVVDLLPADVRPDIAAPANDAPAGVLHVDQDSWQAASEAWWHARGCPDGWWQLLWRLLPGIVHRGWVDLGLVVGWLIEDHGLEAAADAIAQLAGAAATETEHGWTVTWTRGTPR
ncbi:MAG: hypothetical protein AB7O95_13855 [Geminicoccaceae bacterium]